MNAPIVIWTPEDVKAAAELAAKYVPIPAWPTPAPCPVIDLFTRQVIA